MRNNKIIFKFDEIEKIVCDHYEIEYGKLWNTRRIKNTAEARGVFYYISFYINNCIMHGKIAEHSGQTRSNVVNSIKRVNSLMDVDRQYEFEVSKLYEYCESKLNKEEYVSN